MARNKVTFLSSAAALLAVNVAMFLDFLDGDETVVLQYVKRDLDANGNRVFAELAGEVIDVVGEAGTSAWAVKLNTPNGPRSANLSNVREIIAVGPDGGTFDIDLYPLVRAL